MSGPLDLSRITVGTRLPSLTVRFTRETLVRYAGASTDFNPIHYSDHYATQVGLPGVIAHGMLTMGSALRVVTDWVGDPARVRSYFVRFTKPVAVPDDADGTDVAFGGGGRGDRRRAGDHRHRGRQRRGQGARRRPGGRRGEPRGVVASR